MVGVVGIALVRSLSGFVLVPVAKDDEDKPVKWSRRKSTELEEQQLGDQQKVLLGNPAGVERSFKGVCAVVRAVMHLVRLEGANIQITVDEHNKWTAAVCLPVILNDN